MDKVYLAPCPFCAGGAKDDERFSIAFKRLPPAELPMNAVEYETALELLNEAISLGFMEKSVAIVEKWLREHPEERSED